MVIAAGIGVRSRRLVARLHIDLCRSASARCRRSLTR